MRKIFLFFSVLLVLSSALKAQTRTVSGVVTGDKGETLPGVTIKVKGSSTGTQTDIDGKYSLKVTSLQNVVITATYIGYAYQEKTLRGGEVNADFKMMPSATDLNEVVVVGYGEQKKIHLTGAIAVVDTKQIQDIPATDLASTLRGQLPGVSINGGNTRPGINTSSITVRNPTFFVKDATLTQPLYIIDDIFRDQTAFNSLDQTEVESISVLKDAAAAIYGIQGSNGVVVVRTKRGTAGQVKVNYSGTYGTSGAVALPKMLNGVQQATFLNDYYATGQIAGGHTIDPHGYIDGSATNKLTTYYTPDELDNFAQPGNSTDWLRYAFKNATLQRHTLSASGGTDKATYFAGATYVKQTSNFAGAQADRWTYRASVDAKVANGLKVAISLSGSISNDFKYYFKQGGESPDNDFKILTSAPMFTKFYYNGLPVLITGAAGTPSNTNLLEQFNYFAALDLHDYTLSKPTVLNINPTVTYDVPFVKGLKLTANYNRQITNQYGKQVGTNYLAYQFAGLGENNHIIGGNIINTVTQKNGDIVRLNPVFYNTYEASGTLSYNRKFGKHEITFLGLYEQQEAYNEGVQAYVEGLLPGGYDNQNFAIGAMTSSQAGFISQSGRQAYAGRLNYNYANKYLFEGLMRADGTYFFAPGRRWGYFPSFSLGWVASEEGFFKRNVKFMDFLKVRGSIGFLGTNAIKTISYAENYNFGQQSKAAVFGGNGDRGLAIFQNVALANDQIRWDNDTKINGGLDMQFLKNRLGVTIDGFYDHRYNMLATLTSSTPLVVGAAVPAENYAQINGFGYEVSVSWKDQIGKNLSYYVSPWVAWSDDRVVKVDQAAGLAGTFQDAIGQSEDRGVFGYKYAGFFRTQAEVDSYLAAHPGYKINGTVPKPGMLYYEDIRGQKNPAAPGGYNGPDGIIDANDQTYLTSRQNNHFSGGFNFGGSYKNFTLQVVTSLGWGGMGAYESEALSPFKAYSNATQIANRPILWTPGNYWTYSNPDAALPSPYWISKNSGSNDLTSDFWFKSSFQFRMTNLNLSYALPKSIVSKLGVSSIRAYVNCVNPLNFYNPYSYRDNGVGTYETYPLVKSYTFGLNVGF